MKKLLLFIMLFVFPCIAYASETLTIDIKTYNSETHVLTVGGTASKEQYDVIQISLFNDNLLLGMKVANLDNNGEFNQTFKIELNEETEVNIKVAGESATETVSSTIVIPKTENPSLITDSDGNSIKNNKGTFDSNYTFIVEDITSLVDDDILNIIKKSLGENETFLKAYDLNVKNGDSVISLSGGSYTIKIKLTDEMKKYDALKILYVTVDEDDNIEVNETIEGTISGDYVVFTTSHLSYYIVAGVDEIETITSTSNPYTYDSGIALYIVLGLIAIVGIIGTVFYLKKSKKN